MLPCAAVKLLALDFDGVICDSARECFVVAVRTSAEIFPEDPLGAAAETDDALEARFVEIMPLGNRAEDFGVALLALARGRALEDQAAYDAFRASLDPDRLRAFHVRFYELRAAWAAADRAGWLARMPVYPGLGDVLRRRARDVQLAIATSKDRASVRAILAAHGLSELFPERLVLDKEAGAKKHDHVQRLAARGGCAVAEVTFVDDKVNHLEDVAALGTRCVLAAWGYNGARERRLAEARGFLVCDLAGFERAVFAHG